MRRQRSHRRLTLVSLAAFAAVAAAALAWPDTAAGCLIVRSPRPYRPTAPASLLLTGTRDSVAAERAWSNAEWRHAAAGRAQGRGSLREAVADAWSQRPWRPLRGQVVRLERVDGAASLGPLLARGQRRAVLVNWSTTSPCWTQLRVPQTGPLIVPPDTTVLLAATLRPPARWAQGLPTFDVYDGGEPYPQSLDYLRQLELDYPLAKAARATPWLTPAEYMTLTESLPPFDSVRMSAAPYARLFAWERAHPDLAQRFPATYLLGEARDIMRNIAR